MKITEVRRQSFIDFEGMPQEELLFFFEDAAFETLTPGKRGPFFLCVSATQSAKEASESRDISLHGLSQSAEDTSSAAARPVPGFSRDISLHGPAHKKRRALLSARLFQGTLKFYFPDPENYYYLPAEDRAIHRSVAEFVAKAHRKKATKQTAYERCEGLFLPIPPEENEFHKELFRGSPRSFPSYIRYSEYEQADEAFAERYVLTALRMFSS